MSYIKRLVEDDLKEKMSAYGAELIKGPKSCEKLKPQINMQKAC